MSRRAPMFSAFLALIAFIAATSAASAAALEKSTVTLAIGGKIQLAYLPVNIAQQKGFFKQEGLTVDFDDFQGGSNSLQALIGGSVDFISGAYEHTIYLQAKGQTVTTVALQNDSFGLVVSLSKKLAAAYKGPADLKGLKIGVTSPGSSSALGLDLLLSKGGLTANDVSIIGVGAGAGAIATMKAGELDGEAEFDPVVTRLVLDGDLVPVVDTRQKAGLDYLYNGPFAGSAISSTPSFIAKNPKTVQAFVDAMVKALRWLHTATVEEIADALPPEFYAGDKDIFIKAVEANRNMLSQDGIVTPELAQNTFRIVTSFNAKLRSAKIDLSKTYDSSFAIKANQAKE